MNRRRLLIIVAPIVLLVVVYFSGPKPSTPVFDKSMPVVPTEPVALEEYISLNEKKHPVRPDNEARIVWADSAKKKTEYAVVYLHGFFASQMEGDPVHRDFAKEFGCNLYLARLADHGIDTVDQLINFTADRGWESAKEALAIGRAIGEKVIIMSTSSGCTFSLLLAAEYPDDVAALINMSPNIRINHPLAFVANNHWGLQIARIVRGGKFNISPSDSIREKYWYNKFRLEAVSQLQELLEDKMNKETFEKVKCPSLTLYYYKNEQEQDPQVKVIAMVEMSEQLSTPDSLKVKVAMPNAGEHVLGSSLVSKDVEGVYREIEKFAIEKLHFKPVN
jgi:pimeloyl-ACP methyl ester carboxylesterase